MAPTFVFFMIAGGLLGFYRFGFPGAIAGVCCGVITAYVVYALAMIIVAYLNYRDEVESYRRHPIGQRDYDELEPLTPAPLPNPGLPKHLGDVLRSGLPKSDDEEV